ncbi:MAG: sugar phosphate isomerase/epimerase [Burkholderiales bacterium]|nr:sugar phosphate isomerase/epimerase [Burkholderiales bacterium]
MNLERFGMDTVTLAGSLETKLAAMRQAGFSQVMLSSADLVAHPGGEQAAIAAVRSSGLRVTGLQVLRDFEGLAGPLHAWKVDVAKAMLALCRAVGAPLLLACSSTSAHASGDPAQLVADLRKLATLAVPLNIRIAYEALSWGRHVSDFAQACELVEQADRANLGVALDSFHLLAAGTPLEALDGIDPQKLFFVQLSDFLWQETRTRDDRIETARHYRVFPGEGAHWERLAELVRRVDAMGYGGDWSFEVFNDDYRSLPPAMVAERARRAAARVASLVPGRSLPLRRRSRCAARA